MRWCISHCREQQPLRTSGRSRRRQQSYAVEELEHGQRRRVESHLPDVAGLGRPDLDSTGEVGDRSPDEQYSLFKIHVRPSKTPELAASATSRGRDEEQRGQFGILLLGSLNQDLDLLGRRRVRFVPLHARRRCLRGREALEQAPFDPWLSAAEHGASYRRTLVADKPRWLSRSQNASRSEPFSVCRSVVPRSSVMAEAMRRFSSNVLGARPRASMWSSRQASSPRKSPWSTGDLSVISLADQTGRGPLGVALGSSRCCRCVRVAGRLRVTPE